MTDSYLRSGALLLILVLLLPAGVHAQQGCDLALLDRLHPGMQRTELESIVRSAPCGFERREHGTDFVREGLESLPAPSVFRVDLIEYRAYADRDTNEVWMIALKGGHLDRKQSALVPLQMRSVIDALVERFGAPADIHPDEVIARAPVPSPYENVRTVETYASWKLDGRVIGVYLYQTYEGWDIEVKVKEGVPSSRG